MKAINSLSYHVYGVSVMFMVYVIIGYQNLKKRVSVSLKSYHN